jgi:monoamine oxidase
MGAVVKCISTYVRLFWRDADNSGWLLADDDFVQEAFDLTSADGRPALVAFSYGTSASLSAPYQRH